MITAALSKENKHRSAILSKLSIGSLPPARDRLVIQYSRHIRATLESRRCFWRCALSLTACDSLDAKFNIIGINILYVSAKLSSPKLR